MSAKKPTDEKISGIPPFGLRMLPDLKERIATAAAGSGRSMNAEIVFRLENSFKLGLVSTAGYSFFAEVEYDDGLRMNDQLNAELLNSAGAKGISLREEIEERLWFSLKPQNQINERLVDHLLDANMTLQQAQHDLQEARRLLENLSPAEKLILEERAEIMDSKAPKSDRQRAIIEHIDSSPILTTTKTDD